ncbi:peroxiredoxin [Candidatus Mancarchaeum acidiphilum]|uniref:thioredoxin-dependent peroxiredoxin n=1 Tax=Candidatus Mancarchaeum acidiphilum TaxID=1920749 RepID=A0A218NNA7_9ARCH|nr:peroxiredoxin [Candidatus Mancarchaeum acidiphilum]ASI13949.1 peroxiredoxin [Candidatus Mancarchaeum acidiphilum]
MLLENTKAPDFELDGSDGKKHSLDEFKGKYLVLYFYPKDNTPGCTIEARQFNEKIEEIEKLNATVVGVSKDDLKSHDKFKSKFDLKFLLLSDPTSEMIKKYESYGKSMIGFGTLRSTYIIGKDGTILKAYPKVKPAIHADEVIDYLKSVNE